MLDADVNLVFSKNRRIIQGTIVRTDARHCRCRKGNETKKKTEEKGAARAQGRQDFSRMRHLQQKSLYFKT